MTLRLIDSTKWLWCFVALQALPVWSPVSSVTVRPLPKNPSVQTQAKFFQDFFSVQLSPYKIEFGHVCEDPNNWEQRYEKKDYKNHRDMGKVRWGDKQGGYGEHYWDLNHAGHGNNHDDDGSDDGSYHHQDDPYDEPSEQSPHYDSEDSPYDPEKASYDEAARAKRAHPRVKLQRKPVKDYTDQDDDTNTTPQPKSRKNKDSAFTHKEQLQEAHTHVDEKVVAADDDDSEEYQEPIRRRVKPKKVQKKPDPQEEDEDDDESEENSQETEDVKPQSTQYYAPRQPQKHLQQQQQPTQPQEPQPQQKPLNGFVPYENGAGVRQHYPAEVTAASAPVPRLFLEPSTGHVVDRATGQAYVLQPIIVN